MPRLLLSGLRAVPALAGLILLPALGGAAQAQVAIAEIRAQLVLERSGKLSDNLVGADRTFQDTLTGEGEIAEPADAVLITLVMTGPKNSKSSVKIARDLVVVTVRQKSKTGEKVLLSRPYGGFLFGETGRIHKAFLLDNATCAPLSIEVRVGKSSKNAKVDFACKEPAA